ncbi:MAG: SRPBCC family protein [Candidatus Obscuribacterales bacterium]|nr:SRPBCC family protein [Candidatus Obscuribacterales bacterium]
MSIIVLSTEIKAPIEVCFDLSRSIDFHLKSAEQTEEKAIDGVTSGLIGPHETVTFQAKHFGFVFELSGQITAYDRPYHFRDSMIRGPFKRLVHDHIFEHKDGITSMIDRFDFESPLGALGDLLDRMLMREHLSKFLRKRNQYLKEIAETNPSAFL